MEELLKKTLESFKDILKSQEMLCACYAYDYEKNQVRNSFEKFNELWSSFSKEQREKVIICFYSLNNFEMLEKLDENEELGEIQKKLILFTKVNMKTEYKKIK